MLKEYVDFYDSDIPMGKRKLQYIKHLTHNKGFSLKYAINTANKIFGMKREGYYGKPKWIYTNTTDDNKNGHYCTASLMDICDTCGGYDYL